MAPQTETTLSAAEHRKVDLQAPADLSHIHSQLSRAARDKIDRALPPAAAPQGEDDKLRRRVEELVDAYIRNVWTGVQANVRVNGMDVTDADGNVKIAGEADGGVEDGKLLERIEKRRCADEDRP